jgi:hypothetical protein
VSDDGVGAIGWIREIVLDSPDPWALARFWAALLGGTPVEWYPGWVTLEPPPNGQRLSFQGVSGQAAASRHDGAPESAGVHFDIFISSMDSAHDRVIAAGGTFAGEHVSPRCGADGGVISWRVYRDPAGHLFCLVVR